MIRSEQRFDWRHAASIVWMLAAAVFSFWLCWRETIFTGHDYWDDSGYMLSIFEGFRRFGIEGLYTEVYSQYGPAHVLPWIAYLGLSGLEVSHENVGIGVIIL